MKKMTAFFLALTSFMIFMACEKNENAKKTTVAEESTQIANPIQESSAEEILQKIGVEFELPEGAEDISYSIISGQTAQMDFIWNGAKCCARIEPSLALELQDISGFYFDWKNESVCKVSYNEAQVKWTTDENGDTLGICIWWDAVPGLMYSVSMKSNANEENLSALANAIYIQMQGEA